jgi:Uma2 family endonuclease
MSAIARLPAPPSGPPEEDHFVHFRDVSWEAYESVLAIRGDKSAPRVAYIDGVLEIMSPSINHESVKSNIGCLVEVWMDHRGMEYRKLGSWTLKREAERKGAEPDECYAIGGPLDNPERPDLAIEVVWTHGGLDKLAVYADVGVPEVWYWEEGEIRVHILRGSAYVESPHSEVLESIDVELLASFLDRTSTSTAKREYRAALED